MKKPLSQTTSRILMLRPHLFGFNEQTMASNAFQKQNLQRSAREYSEKALNEFDEMVEMLQKNGVEVKVVQDTAVPPKPDAVFPNNWVMFHHNSDVSLFPMEAENRRYERRVEIIEDLKKEFVVGNIHNFSEPEKSGRYLEGTGSIVFDHQNRIAYACISSRTDPALLKDFCEEMGYEEQSFASVDKDEKAIYHTNVIMCVGEKLAVLCTESISDQQQRLRIINRLKDTGHDVVEISLQQVLHFAGNMLQLTNHAGEKLMLMSTRAYQSLNKDQLQVIRKHTKILHTPLSTIEDIGGGSARCMMAEIFLPLKS